MTQTSRTSEAARGWAEEIQTGFSWPLRIAVWTLLTFIFVGLGWASVASYHGAAIASGAIIATGHNKTLSHLEGGIIEQVLVSEGQSVKAGEVLAKFDRTTAEANLRRLQLQVQTLGILAARLTAERDGKTAFIVPETPGVDLSSPEYADLVANQRGEFEARQSSHEAAMKGFSDQLEALDQQNEGLVAQLASARSQKDLIGLELRDVRTLYSKGLTPKPRLLALERGAAQLAGQIGDLIARIATTKTNAAEIRNRQQSFQDDWIGKILAELRDTQMQLADAQSRLTAALDSDTRLTISAPVDGVVSKIYTPAGAVVGSGQPIIDLVPYTALQVEVRVRPDDIDAVKAGSDAELRFLAFQSRAIPSVRTKVTYVSADRVNDPRAMSPQQSAYFVARLDIPMDEVTADGLQLAVGMPVEAFVMTGERTLLSYLVNPIIDVLHRSFREE